MRLQAPAPTSSSSFRRPPTRRRSTCWPRSRSAEPVTHKIYRDILAARSVGAHLRGPGGQRPSTSPVGTNGEGLVHDTGVVPGLLGARHGDVLHLQTAGCGGDPQIAVPVVDVRHQPRVDLGNLTG